MIQNGPYSSRATRLVVYIALSISLLALLTVACGVKSGDRRPARETPISEFHRTTVTAFEQVRIDLAITEDGCSSVPADLTFSSNQRVRLAIQLPADIVQGETGSLEVTGESVTVNYKIEGLEISGAAGTFAIGATEVDLTMSSGARQNYDFNLVNTGTFDILCDGEKIGTFTVTES